MKEVAIKGKGKIVIVGCDGYAVAFHTGDKPEVKEVSNIFAEDGKEVPTAVIPPFGEFTCYFCEAGELA